MILVDTSVWVDHLRRGEPLLVQSLLKTQVATHPFVVGELACGKLKTSALISGVKLWTRDKRLHDIAQTLNCAWAEPVH